MRQEKMSAENFWEGFHLSKRDIVSSLELGHVGCKLWKSSEHLATMKEASLWTKLTKQRWQKDGKNLYAWWRSRTTAWTSQSKSFSDYRGSLLCQIINFLLFMPHWIDYPVFCRKLTSFKTTVSWMPVSFPWFISLYCRVTF